MEDKNKSGRKSLKSLFFAEKRHFTSDQMKKIPPPPLQKDYPEDATLIDLIDPKDFSVGEMSLIEAINKRRSKRRFNKKPLSIEELSFLLWCTQGVQKIIGDGVALWRTVPSGGARHPFETYLCIFNVEKLDPGVYRYLSLEHKLMLIRNDLDDPYQIDKTLISKAPVVFIWTVIPYRSEWRYGAYSYKTIAQESGHICQNLYLASEAIGAGTCAVGAYNQELMDKYIGVDGTEEFTIYIARVGKINPKKSKKSLLRQAELYHGYRSR